MTKNLDIKERSAYFIDGCSDGYSDAKATSAKKGGAHKVNMPSANVEIVRELLEGILDSAVVNRLVAEDADYVSLTFDNPELKRLMPWAGTHAKGGPAAFLEVFGELHRRWDIQNFKIQDAVGEGDRVALFGTFTTHSVRLNKRFTSPFAILCRLKDGLVTYMLYMEDTFGTGSTFRSGGSWRFQSDLSGTEVKVGQD